MTLVQVPEEHLLTPAEVAALVFVDPKTVSRWASAGKLSSTRTAGGHRRFRSADVHAFLSQEHDRRKRCADTSNPPRGQSALEAHAEAAAKVVLQTAASFAASAQESASAAVNARRTMGNTSETVLMAMTVQAATDAASTDVALAAAGVAQTVTDAAARLAVMFAAFGPPSAGAGSH